MKHSLKQLCMALLVCTCGAGSLTAQNHPINSNSFMEEKLTLTITLAADLYMPKDATGKLPAIAICGPFGAVKEQSSGLYAQALAERGFLTLAFDPSFTGESGGTPRYVASPDINTEDFCAAVDYLSAREDTDPERIGILGICGWGGMAINAAAIDTRIKGAALPPTVISMRQITPTHVTRHANN